MTGREPVDLFGAMEQVEIEKKAAARRQVTSEPTQPVREEDDRARQQARQIVGPMVQMVEDNFNDLESDPEGPSGFFPKLWKKIQEAPGKIADGTKQKIDSGMEKMTRMVKGAVRAIGRFNQANRHEMHKLLGKTPEERRRKIVFGLLLGGLGVLAVCNWGGMFVDMFKKHGDGSGGVPTPEGEGEQNNDYYQASAIAVWQKYKDQGPKPGGMLDPLAIGDMQTILVSGYVPGWFCVPERVAICEEMIGEKLNLPEDETERKVFFIEMQDEWDEKYWPKVRDNQKLDQQVRDFYNPANRANLREEFRRLVPVTPTPEASLMMKQTVADKMFIDLMETGKLVPERPNILTYSHLLGSFVAAVYLTNSQSILMPMQKKGGFVPEEGGRMMKSGMLPPEVREAYKQIEIISRRSNSNLLDIALYTNVINEYNQKVEIARELKTGSLGRL